MRHFTHSQPGEQGWRQAHQYAILPMTPKISRTQKAAMKQRNNTEATHRAAWIMVAILLLFPAFGQAQVPVSLAPSVHPQYLDSTGKVLAGGFLYTYQAGTTTLQTSYADSAGTIANSNPIPLDASGSPSNSSGAQVEVWLSNNAYKLCAYNSALVQQWCWDNVNAYQILNSLSNLTFGSVTVDPVSPSAGELWYRSDIPCFRGYTTFADCFVRLTDVQTLTNKTLAGAVITGSVTGGATYASPALTTPSINGTTVSGPPANYLSLSNDITTGTTANTLTKMLGATAIISATTDTGGAVGITVSGAGKSGSATIQQNGSVSCVFDGSATAGDYVQISSTVAGNCHDTGSAYPTNGQVIGRAQVTGAGAGTYAIVLFSPEIKPTQTVSSANLTAQAANISSTPMLTPSVNGFYRFSCYTVVTQAATVSSTLPQCSVTYTDADSGVAETQTVTNINTGNTLGATGVTTSGSSIPTFFAKSGVAISYLTSSYASSGATPMQYAIHVRLEGPF